jgi:4a-hydroxytetrahydrobiopterin dehydratase
VPERLSEDELATGLAGLSWDRDGDELVKVVTKRDFGEAMQFVNVVALLAEGANHHPDIAISWNRVTLRVTTHDAGGLSQLDLDLAAAIDDVA